jgi:hypothetical protein
MAALSRIERLVMQSAPTLASPRRAFLFAILRPASLAAITFEHANRNTGARVHHFVDEQWLGATLASARRGCLFRGEDLIACKTHWSDPHRPVKYQTSQTFLCWDAES